LGLLGLTINRSLDPLQTLLSHWRQLTAPRATDDDQAHREYLTKVILIMMGGILFAFTLLLSAGWIWGLFGFRDIAPLLALDAPVFGALWLAQHGHWRPTSYVPPAITFSLAVYLNSLSGLATSGQLFYLLTILLTALLIGVKAQWLMVGLIIITYLGISSSIEPFFLEITLPTVVMLGAALIGTALLQWISTHQLKRWLSQSRLFASELSKRSTELSNANQELRKEVSERLQAEAALQQLADRLKALHQVDQAVLTARSLVEIAQAVLNRIRLLVACQRASITLFDLQAGRGTILAVDVDGNTNLSNSIHIALKEFGGIHEMEQGRHRLISDLQVFPGIKAVEKRLMNEGIRAILNVPLLSQGRLIGSINLGAVEPYAFRQEHIDIASELAGSLAVALQNARLFAETRQRAEELQALADISLTLRSALTLDQMLPGLLEKTSSLLGAEFGNVYLIERETGDLVAWGWYPPTPETIGIRLHKGEGISGHVAASGEMYLTENLQDDPWLVVLPEEADLVNKIQCGLSLPLRTNQQTVGVINFGSSGSHILKPDKLQLAKAIAEMAANAIWRATLFEETQQRFEHLLALRMIDRAITSSPELSLLLDILLDQVILQLHVDAATVLLISPHTRTLDFASQRGFHTDTLQSTHLSLGEGHAGRAAQEQRIIQIRDLTQHYGDFSRAVLLADEEFQAYFAVPLIAKGQIKGVLEIFHRSPLDPDREWMGFLDAIATQAAIAIDNARLFENLQTANIDLVKAYDATIEGWSRALDLRDKETEGHSQRVAEMTVRLAREMGVKDEELVHIQRGSLLHDIGKMGIPDSILLKPASLTEDEWRIMCQHPLYAYQLLSPIAYLRPALDIPYCHHEKWDGSGYPRGLKGEQIPLAARIFAIVDVWDALSSERPYREAWDKGKILDYIAKQSGLHFDPQVVEVFFRLLRRSQSQEFVSAPWQQTSALHLD
jgi:HD-GYP domain-containing protein (c-di-GMP phosphodiesterase class II)